MNQTRYVKNLLELMARCIGRCHCKLERKDQNFQNWKVIVKEQECFKLSSCI
jgi:hypothetical protein